MDERAAGEDRGEQERFESASSESAERVIVPFTVEEMADSRAARVWWVQ